VCVRVFCVRVCVRACVCACARMVIISLRLLQDRQVCVTHVWGVCVRACFVCGVRSVCVCVRVCVCGENILMTLTLRHV